MPAQIHVGDVGTEFVAVIRDEAGEIVDLRAASVRLIRFRKPDGTVSEHQAELVTDGSDGQIRYRAGPGDIDQEGEWQRQAFVRFPGGEWYTDVIDFYVHGNL
jgi:hypothetical protein